MDERRQTSEMEVARAQLSEPLGSCLHRLPVHGVATHPMLCSPDPLRSQPDNLANSPCPSRAEASHQAASSRCRWTTLVRGTGRGTRQWLLAGLGWISEQDTRKGIISASGRAWHRDNYPYSPVSTWAAYSPAYRVAIMSGLSWASVSSSLRWDRSYRWRESI